MTLPTCFIAGVMVGALYMALVMFIVNRPVPRAVPRRGAPMVNLLDLAWHRTRTDKEEIV